MRENPSGERSGGRDREGRYLAGVSRIERAGGTQPLRLEPDAALSVSAAVAAVRGQAAFTMVEIALCLAIIAFALVAIIGVLPTGLQVQKENSQETIITQDGLYFLELIGKGAVGADELTNYVMRISLTNGQPPAPVNLDGTRIVGLLSTPKYEVRNGVFRSNIVTAHVRAISGPAVTRDPKLSDVTFSYLLRSEVVPLDLFPTTHTNYRASGLSAAEIFWRSNNWRMAINAASNFYELRLTLQWPLFQQGQQYAVGNNSKTFRRLMGGQLVLLTNLSNERLRFFLMQPGSYAKVL